MLVQQDFRAFLACGKLVEKVASFPQGIYTYDSFSTKTPGFPQAFPQAFPQKIASYSQDQVIL